MKGRTVLYQRILVGLLILLTGCAPRNSVSQPVQSIVYGLTSELASLDPHMTSSIDAGVVLRQVYDTLVYRDGSTNEFVPGLATDWAISEDGRRYTFRLRDDVQFHDGTAFNALAVADNLDRIINLDGRAAALLGPYRGYEIVDSRTIVIRLNEPFSPLLDSLSQPYLGIASPLALSEYSNQRYQFYQAGTGPFRFDEYVPGQYVTIERNTGYTWQPSIYQPPENPVQQVIFRFYETEEAQQTAIEQGEIDILGQVSPGVAQSQSVNANVQVIPVTLPGQPMQFLMNTTYSPLDLLTVRQALLHGTNRAEISNTIFRGFSTAASAPLSPPTLFYNRQLVGLYEYNIVLARDLLEEAGYEDTNDDGLVDQDGENVQLVMLVPPGVLHSEVATALQEQWRTVGIDVVIRIEPTRNSLQAAIEDGDYHLVLAYDFGVDPYFIGDYFATEGDRNWGNYEFEELTAQLQRGRQARDFTTRATAYLEAQTFIMDEALILPIRDYVQLNVVRVRLQNVTYDAYGWHPLLFNVNLAA